MATRPGNRNATGSPTATTAARRPWTYFVLVLVLASPFWLAAVATGGRPLFLGLPVSLFMAAVPMLVASGLGVRDGGRAGLRAVWSGVFDPRRVRPRGWWAVLAVPGVAAGLGWLVSPTLIPTGAAGAGAAIPWVVLPAYFALFYLGAIPEEIGWTGYATRGLLDRHGVLVTGLATGAVWHLIHLVPYLTMGHDWSWVGGQFVLSVASRVLMVLAYAHGGRSLALGCALHAMMNVVQMFPYGFLAFDPWPSVPGTLVIVAVLGVATSRGGSPVRSA